MPTPTYTYTHLRTGRNTQMLGNFFKTPEPKGTTAVAPKPTAAKGKAGAGGGGRLNLKTIPKEAPPAPKKAAAPAMPSFSFGAKKKAAAPAEPTARMVGGKLQGYFTNEQIEALEIARREIPSSVPGYWNKIAAKVPGQTAETCKAMTNQILLDKARGTGKQFFGGYVEVKETEMVVDMDATPMKRLMSVFGRK